MDGLETLCVILAIVIVIIVVCHYMRAKPKESLVSPYNLSETNADLVELSMRRNLYK